MKKGTIMGCLLALIAYTIALGISWIATCGVVYLITLCFSCAFSWLVATGIWLICIFLSCIFG